MQISNSSTGKRARAQPFYEPADQPAKPRLRRLQGQRRNTRQRQKYGTCAWAEGRDSGCTTQDTNLRQFAFIILPARSTACFSHATKMRCDMVAQPLFSDALSKQKTRRLCPKKSSLWQYRNGRNLDYFIVFFPSQRSSWANNIHRYCTWQVKKKNVAATSGIINTLADFLFLN